MYQKYAKGNLFYKWSCCPICDGDGFIECCDCSTGNQECVPIDCDVCRGRGYRLSIDKKNSVLLSTCIVLVISICFAIKLLQRR